MTDEFTLGVIGLDTSHTIAFTRLIQGEDDSEQAVRGLRIRRCMRFPSPFQSEPDQDKRQAQLEQWGVEVSTSLDDTVRDVDGILLELNDPAMHLHYVRRIADLGKPVFLDKPLAANLDEGRQIVALAADRNLPLWSSSSLRFLDTLDEARKAVGNPEFGSFFGALGKAAAGSDLIWYGVHTVEMQVAAMGTGAASVRAHQDSRGIVQTVQYADGRRAVTECNQGAYFYGGRLQSKDTVRHFDSCSSESLYVNLLTRIRAFFLTGTVPVPLAETLEVQAILDAGERSLASGCEEEVQH